MRYPLISILLLVLFTAPLMSPIEASPSTIASTLLYRKPEQSSVSVLVEGASDLGVKAVGLLEDFGTVTTIVGRVAVLQTQTANLNSISHLPFITRVERTWPLSVYLDKSVPDIGANVVWDEVKDPTGRNVTGSGVIIGFVDTGIDWSHPDFTFPNGTTKILYIWDQTNNTIPSAAPTGFGYGYECVSSDIQAAKCPERDTFGHGTHVAGIATSSGRATGNYTGVAPGSSIIFVKSGHVLCNGTSWTFDSSQILDGVNYIVEKAAQLGRRAVINLSLGGNIGGHDGTDPMEIALDSFVKKGTPIVVAAGNQEQDNAHIQGQLTKGGSVTFNVGLKETTTDLAIDVWYSAEDVMTATLLTPDGKSYSSPTSTQTAQAQFGNATVTAMRGSSDLGRELYFEISSQTSLSTSGWRVRLNAQKVNSDGLWDSWVDSSSCDFPGASFAPGTGYQIDLNDTLGIPSTAHYVVTVGAYVTKTSWKGKVGQVFGSPDATTGGIAPFSSRGPTRDGRTKPDVAAPGMLIASARSSSTSQSPSDPDAFHRILAGTSMATPHVSGVIALMLQYEPNLDATTLPKTLGETARLDSQTGLLTSGSPTWGFGKLDARTATGLFRLTLIPENIPSNLNVPVQVDNGQELEAASNAWLELYFLKGTTRTVIFDERLQVENGTRYTLEQTRLTANANSIGTLNYAVQYYLTVKSDYDNTSGSGWYNANTTVQVEATRQMRAQGLLGNLGGAYTLSYWITDSGKIITGTVTMEGPKTVRAVYVLTFPWGVYATIVIIGTAIALFVWRRRRNP